MEKEGEDKVVDVSARRRRLAADAYVEEGGKNWPTKSESVVKGTRDTVVVCGVPKVTNRGAGRGRT